VKDRFHAVVRTPIALAAILAAFAFALAGCSGSNTAGGSSQDTGGAAAAGGGAAGGRHRMAEALMGLGLSDAQKSQIRDIMSAARKQSAGADPATRRANFAAAMAKIDTVLTPGQRTKLHQKLDQMRSERQQSSSPPPA
jgi:Spy/CpxP family protein refolding chaperone